MNDNEYPYGSNPGDTQYPYGRQPGNTQYPYGQDPGNNQYPYGQDRNAPYPYRSGQNGSPYPYGNRQGGAPYGGQPYGYYPPKKTFGQKLREAFADPARRELMLLGMAAGAGILLYLLFSDIFSSILMVNRELYQRYTEDEAFSLLLETMYTIFCVSLPFALLFAVLKKIGSVHAPICFNKPRGGWQTVLLIPAGLAVCLFGSLLSSWMVSLFSFFGISFSSYEYALEQQTNAPQTLGLMLLTVVHTAVLPALLEELVFRGFIMQPLRRYGDWFAIITSALIFGLVHGNMTQAPFAIFAGLALGYVNVVTGSMWTNILLHFCNNLVAVLSSFALTAAGESMGLLLSAGVMYGLIAIGIAAFVGYARANKDFARLRPGDAPPFPHKAAHFWLMPTVLLALVLMFIRIAQDIVLE